MEKGLTTKSDILEYLRGVKEIEKDIYTLERMEVELRERDKKLKQQENQAFQAKLDTRKAEVRRCEKELQAVESTKPKFETSSIWETIGTIFFSVIIQPIIGAVLGAIIGVVIGIVIGVVGGLIYNFVIYVFTDIQHDVSAWRDMFNGACIGVKLGFNWGAILGIVITAILAVVVIVTLPTKRRNEKLYIKEKAKYNEAISSAKAKLAEAEKACNISPKKVDYYEKPINDICKSLATIYANREKIYSVGIVPPDYRTMDCVYVLEHIFRNDLADTMREAILLYEERAFRGEVLRGMQNIASHLSNLSGVMSTLRADMDRIGRDVALMSGDLSRVYEQNRIFAADVARQNDRIYEETKLHRYAVEALEKSNQRIVDYIDDNT